MRYVPKGLSKKYSEDCSLTNRHYWRPVTDFGTDPGQWHWTCVSCHYTVDRRPPDADQLISLRDLEAMVDSSLRLADRVVIDDQSVKGDLWLMRHAEWDYQPYSFKILYHIFRGEPFVVLFRWTAIPSGPWSRWHNLNDTDSYRIKLQQADSERIKDSTRIIF